MQAGSAKDKAYKTGQDTVDSASATGKQAYDATKGAAEDLSATLKSYVSWAQSKASELTKSSKDTTNVSINGCIVLLHCIGRLFSHALYRAVCIEECLA